MDAEANIKQTVPFFAVSSMENSLRFYIDGLGFKMTKSWTPEGDPDGKICEAGGRAMLFEVCGEALEGAAALVARPGRERGVAGNREVEGLGRDLTGDFRAALGDDAGADRFEGAAVEVSGLRLFPRGDKSGDGSAAWRAFFVWLARLTRFS